MKKETVPQVTGEDYFGLYFGPSPDEDHGDSLDVLLAEAERFAQEVWTRYCHRPDGRPVRVFRGSDRHPTLATLEPNGRFIPMSGVPYNVARQVKFAQRILAYCRIVRDSTEQGDIVRATRKALWLGRYYEALKICPAEHDAFRGQKTGPNAGRAGHVAAYGTPEQKNEKWAAYQTTIEDLHRKFPRWSYCRLCGEAGRRHKVNAKTIERHTSNPRV